MPRTALRRSRRGSWACRTALVRRSTTRSGDAESASNLTGAVRCGCRTRKLVSNARIAELHNSRRPVAGEHVTFTLMSSKTALAVAEIPLHRGVTVAAAAAGGMMTKSIWTGTYSFIIVGTAVVAMAQTSAAQQNTSPSAEQKMIVTGCLRAAPSTGADAAATAGTTGTTPPGTAGTTGAAGPAGAATDSADAKFVLADAVISSAKADTESAPAAAGTTAAAGSASTARSQQTYQLIANGAALRPHVGKKLELTVPSWTRPLRRPHRRQHQQPGQR